jgi:hypothetical protein
VVTLTNHEHEHAWRPEDEIGYLRNELALSALAVSAARLESANRLAAIRAALGAARDGEPDPLAYLRDQLAEETGIPGSGGSGL